MKPLEAIAQLGDAVADLEDLLEKSELEPDPERRNWLAHGRDLATLEARVDLVLKHLSSAWMLAQGSDLRPGIAEKTATVLCSAALVLELAGRSARSKEILERALALAEDGNASSASKLLHKALANPTQAAEDCYARWRTARGSAPSRASLRRNANSAFLDRIGSVGQTALVLGLIGLAGWYVLTHLSRPRQGEKVETLRDIDALVADGGASNALDRYVRLANDKRAGSDAKGAADRVASLLVSRFPSPCTRDAMPQVRILVSQMKEIPIDAQTGAPNKRLVARLLQCAGELESSPLEVAHALGLLAAVSTDDRERADFRARRNAILLRAAEGASAANPLFALSLYRATFPEEQGLQQASKLVDALNDTPALLVAASPVLRAWEAHATSDKRWEARRAELRARLDKAQQEHSELETLVASASSEDLASLQAKTPKREEVAFAYARSLRESGELDKALALLKSLGPPGKLSYEARLELAAFFRDQGDTDGADALLSAAFEELSPAYRDALARVESTRRDVTKRETERVRSARRIQADDSLDEAGQAEVERAVGADPALQLAEAESSAAALAVQASVALAALCLERADKSSDEARSKQLERAESVLLELRAEASGQTDYDVQLGVVFHRVGKKKEGEAVFEKALDRASSPRLLLVAHGIHSIGQRDRARQVAEKAYATANTDDERYEAASYRATLHTTVEDELAWWKRCDTSTEYVRDNLKKIEADLALRDGKDAEAETLLAELTERALPKTKQDPVEANNTALLFDKRYEATGNREHLVTALRLLAAASAARADDTILLGNLANALEQIVAVDTLERWVHTSVLRPAAADTILEMVLFDSSLRPAARRSLRKHPRAGLALRTRSQHTVLTPQDSGSARTKRAWQGWLEDTESDAWSLFGPSIPSWESSTIRSDAGVDASAEPSPTSLADADRTLHRAQRTLERAQADGHPPTIALAKLLLARALRLRNQYDLSEARASESVAHAVAALESWSALKGNDEIFFALLEGAVARTRSKSSTALQELWDRPVHKRAPLLIIPALLSAPSPQEALTALRNDAGFQQASALLRTYPSGGGLLGWALARVQGDEAWRRRAATEAKTEPYGWLRTRAEEEPDGVAAAWLAVVKQAQGE